MLRKATLAAALMFFLISALVGISVWNRHLVAGQQEREGHFIAIHFLAADAAKEEASGEPRDPDDLLKTYPGLDSAFPEGLLYQAQGVAFTLEESRPRRVSLFRRDRLISTERKWPRWESSGSYARKFPEQKVPPAGYE